MAMLFIGLSFLSLLQFRIVFKKGTREMKLLEEAKKLADDIAEYAPSTNIELMIRDLIKEIERLQSEKTVAVKSKTKAKAG